MLFKVVGSDVRGAEIAGRRAVMQGGIQQVREVTCARAAHAVGVQGHASSTNVATATVFRVLVACYAGKVLS